MRAEGGEGGANRKTRRGAPPFSCRKHKVRGARQLDRYAVYSSNCAVPEPFPFSPSPITRLPRLWTPPRAARLPVRRNRLGARRAAAAVLGASSILPEECVAEGQSQSWSLLAKTNAAVLRSQELRQGAAEAVATAAGRRREERLQWDDDDAVAAAETARVRLPRPLLDPSSSSLLPLLIPPRR